MSRNETLKRGLVVIVIIVIGGLILYASTKKYEDSHLRAEGLRVKVPDNTIIFDDTTCKNAILCEKEVNLRGKKNVIAFEYHNFKDDGFPTTIIGTINGNEFYRRSDIDIEKNYNYDFTIVGNFNTLNDEVAVFTIKEGYDNRTTTLYAIDINGNVVLKKYDIDKDEMKIKDYSDYVTYKDNSVTVYASRIIDEIDYHGKSVCEADPKTIVESYYTYTYKDGSFTEKVTKKETAKEYIARRKIDCDKEV